MKFPGRETRLDPWREILNRIEVGGEVTEPEVAFVSASFPNEYKEAKILSTMSPEQQLCYMIQKDLDMEIIEHLRRVAEGVPGYQFFKPNPMEI